MYRASGIDEAIEIANAPPSGSDPTPWTNDEAEQERFIDDIEAGQVFINGDDGFVLPRTRVRRPSNDPAMAANSRTLASARSATPRRCGWAD